MAMLGMLTVFFITIIGGITMFRGSKIVINVVNWVFDRIEKTLEKWIKG